MNEYWKALLIKALWAALYGGLAQFLATQSVNKDTAFVALISAAVRAVIIFATTIQDNIAVNKAVAAKNVQPVIKTWKSYL